MKCVFWNIPGLANAPSRLALKRILISHKPDFVFMAELKIDFDNFPNNWFSRYGLKIFSTNILDKPTLWCLCKEEYNPSIMFAYDQFVAFQISLDNKVLAIAVVYASTNLYKRRDLWSELSNLFTIHPLPWAFSRDFNAIMGAHEHRGKVSLAKRPMQDFQNWSNNNSLIHFPTAGAMFTWSNKREPYFFVERRLDRCIGSSIWTDICNFIAVSSLPKLRSDHHPLLLKFHINLARSVPHFKFLNSWSLHDSCKQIISSAWPRKFVGCPIVILSNELLALKKNLKVWNKQTVGNISDNVKYEEDQLRIIQNNIQVDGLNDSLKSKEVVDTAYFHRLSKVKKTFRPISMLVDGDNTITDPTEIANHTVRYFENLFATNLSFVQDFSMVDHTIPSLVDEASNGILTNIPSMEEIFVPVFSLNGDSAPNSDGFEATFYQTY